MTLTKANDYRMDTHTKMFYLHTYIHRIVAIIKTYGHQTHSWHGNINRWKYRFSIIDILSPHASKLTALDVAMQSIYSGKLT